jgi:hypothetical protein
MAAYTTSTVKSTSGGLDLSGIYPPIVTPFEKNEQVSDKGLEENMRTWNSIPFRGRKALFLTTPV